MGLGQGVGRHAQVALGVVQDEVFRGDELAGEPEAGAGVSKIQPRHDAVADRAGAQAFVEAGERVLGVRSTGWRGRPTGSGLDRARDGSTAHWAVARVYGS